MRKEETNQFLECKLNWVEQLQWKVLLTLKKGGKNNISLTYQTDKKIPPLRNMEKECVSFIGGHVPRLSLCDFNAPPSLRKI